MSLSSDLNNLKYVGEIFDALASGKHIDASQDSVWWMQLQGDNKDDYELLFNKLGKKLVVDPHGFAYFDFDDTNQKAAQQIVLLFLLIFRRKHENGADLLKFTSWELDPSFMEELFEQNRKLLEDEGVDSDNKWNRIVNKAESLGFMVKRGDCYWLLNAAWRVLNIFEEIASSDNENVEDDSLDSLNDGEDDDAE